MIAITVDCEQWNAPALRGKKDLSNDNTSYSFNGNKELLRIFDKNKRNPEIPVIIIGKYSILNFTSPL